MGIIIERGAKRPQAEHLTDTAVLTQNVENYSKVENIAVLTLKPVTGGQDADGLEILSDFTGFATYSQTPTELTTANKIYYLYNIDATMDTESPAFLQKLVDIFKNNSTLIITSDISSTLLDNLNWLTPLDGNDNLVMLTMKNEDTTTWEPMLNKKGVGVFYSPTGQGEPLDVITFMTLINKLPTSPMGANGRAYDGVTNPDQSKLLKDKGFSFVIDALEDNFGYSVFFGGIQYFTLLIWLNVEQEVKVASSNYLKEPLGQTFGDLPQFQGIANNAAIKALKRKGLVKNFVAYMPDISKTDLDVLNSGNVESIVFSYEAERQQLHHSLIFGRG